MPARRTRRFRWLDYPLIMLGAGICGVAITMLLEPNDVVPGGVTGLAMILQDVLGLPMGAILITLNIPLLALGWRLLGGVGLLVRTALGVVSVSLTIDLLAPHVTALTNDRLLVIFYGGLLSGIGLALVFRGRGTTGGADILGRLLNRWFDAPVGQAILLLNVVVFSLAGWLYGLEPAAVALLVSFVMTKVLDTVLHGLSATRSALVVTERPEAVRDNVIEHLRRTVTILPGTGGFSGRSLSVLYIVVSRAEITRLKRRVHEADPDAFTTIYSPQEVLGAGMGTMPGG